MQGADHAVGATIPASPQLDADMPCRRCDKCYLYFTDASNLRHVQCPEPPCQARHPADRQLSDSMNKPICPRVSSATAATCASSATPT